MKARIGTNGISIEFKKGGSITIEKETGDPDIHRWVEMSDTEFLVAVHTYLTHTSCSAKDRADEPLIKFLESVQSMKLVEDTVTEQEPVLRLVAEVPLAIDEPHHATVEIEE